MSRAPGPLQPVRFIYFDVGGVVISDFSGTNNWTELKTELGVKPKFDKEFMNAWYPLEHEVLVGRDLESILPGLAKQFNLRLPKDYLLQEGFVKRFSANKFIWPAITNAQKRFKIGLLTNMYPGMLDSIHKHGYLPDISWDAVVDSSIEMLQKPDRRLFELAEKKAGFNGDKILFIDNTPGHLQEAREFGWQTYFYDASNHEQSSKELIDYIDSLGS